MELGQLEAGLDRAWAADCRLGSTSGSLRQAWIELGLLTAGFAQLPWNPISALCLSTAICARWTMVGHHVSHGGYSKEVGIEHRFHRANFARGPWRRFVDWCDWMQPEAWDVEHNFMHHVSGMAPMSRCLE